MKTKSFRLRNNFLPRILFCSSSVVLVLFGILVIVSPVEPNTNALVETTNYGNGLSVATNSTVDATIRPKSDGSLLVVKDTLVANSNLQYGYEVYISANSDASSDIYLNGKTSNNLSNQKISAAPGTYAAPAALDLTNGATWGYAIAGLDNFDATYDEENPANTSKFAAMPTIGNEQLIHDVSTTVSDDEINVYYGIKMDADLEPGIYKTDILYTIIPRTTRPCNGICYDGNGGNGTMTDQAAEPNNEVSLYAPNFSRDGYGFVGWNTAADGTGTMYGPNETITMPAEGGLFLYAQWLAPEQNATLQAFNQTDSTYANAATGTIIALEDERDGNVYTVAKLADNNWWMIENLRFDLSADGDQIDVINTNNPTSAFMTAASAKPASTNVWCEDTTAACIDQIAYNTDNTANGSGGARNIYGVYYNWYTVTAGNGTYAQTSGDADGDICPAGWHLPTGGNNGEFFNLNYAVNDFSSVTDNSLAIRKYSNNFTNAGYYYGSGIVARGAAGSYWSSTARSAANSYRLGFNSSRISPGLEDTGDGKQYGRTIRCVANRTSTTFTLSYDGNSGSGAPAAQTDTNTHRGYTFTISNTEPTLSGYEFYGWSTNQSATTADYQPGDEITLDETNNTATLYAVWGVQRTAKAILGSNNNLNFVYNYNAYTVNDTYTDNLGSTTIMAVYDVPANVTQESGRPQWTSGANTAGNNNPITSANFDQSFYNFKPTSTAYWFYYVKNLASITNIDKLNTSNVTNMTQMFSFAGHSATTFDLGNLGSWNVGNVTNMQNMFYNAGYSATTWKIGDISGWTVTNVTNHINFINLNANSTNASVVNNQPGGWT